MLTKWLEKNLDSNYTRMLQAILNKSWRQQPTKHQRYSYLPPIMKTIQVRRTRHTGHCWRSRDELVSDVLLWTPTYSWAKAGWPAWTYIQQLCKDTGCSPEDLPEVMNDREKWRKRVRNIRAGGTIWWWWLCKKLSRNNRWTIPNNLRKTVLKNNDSTRIKTGLDNFDVPMVLLKQQILWFYIYYIPLVGSLNQYKMDYYV